jgi:hypothetical protein
LTVSILEVLQDVSSPLAKLLLLGQLVLVSWMAQAAPVEVEDVMGRKVSPQPSGKPHRARFLSRRLPGGGR